MQRHKLTVRHKSSRRLVLVLVFECVGSKLSAYAASVAVLRANPGRFECEITGGDQ